jgi:hypothetical protein
MYMGSGINVDTYMCFSRLQVSKGSYKSVQGKFQQQVISRDRLSDLRDGNNKSES